MRGIPQFNFPAFNAAASRLRAGGDFVFNPAERDAAHYGEGLFTDNQTGDLVQAADTHGFSLREALAADTQWICREADTIALLPGWEASKGARAELALSEALGHDVIFLAE